MSFILLRVLLKDPVSDTDPLSGSSYMNMALCRSPSRVVGSLEGSC